MTTIASIGVYALTLYALVGLVFGVAFVWRGAARIDPGAAAGTWGFRLLILPGAAALWPLLLRRWVRHQEPPGESNAHRDAAQRGAKGERS